MQGRSKADYWQYRITAQQIQQMGKTAAEVQATGKIAIAASAFALGYQVTGFGEGVLGTVAATGATIGYLNSWNPWGWGTLAVISVGTYVKSGIDVTHSLECKPAGEAAQRDYADGDNLWRP